VKVKVLEKFHNSRTFQGLSLAQYYDIVKVKVLERSLNFRFRMHCTMNLEFIFLNSVKVKVKNELIKRHKTTHVQRYGGACP